MCRVKGKLKLGPGRGAEAPAASCYGHARTALSDINMLLTPCCVRPRLPIVFWAHLMDPLCLSGVCTIHKVAVIYLCQFSACSLHSPGHTDGDHRMCTAWKAYLISGDNRGRCGLDQ